MAEVKALTKEECEDKIDEVVLAIDGTEHKICQPMLKKLIERATEIHDMRDKEMREWHRENDNIPDTAKVIPFVSRDNG